MKGWRLRFLFYFFALVLAIALPILLPRDRTKRSPAEAGEAEKKTAKQIFREADYLVHLRLQMVETESGLEYPAALSGILINYNGRYLILTAAHYNLPGSKLTSIVADLKGGPQNIPISLYKQNLRLDCAAFKIDDPEFKFSGKLAKLQLDRQPTVGEKVYALGSPLMTDFCVTEGIINNLNYGSDQNDLLRWKRLLIHSAPIYPGNSGGPLVNETGEVIGMNVGIDEYYQNFAMTTWIEDILLWLAVTGE